MMTFFVLLLKLGVFLLVLVAIVVLLDTPMRRMLMEKLQLFIDAARAIVNNQEIRKRNTAGPQGATDKANMSSEEMLISTNQKLADLKVKYKALEKQNQGLIADKEAQTAKLHDAASRLRDVETQLVQQKQDLEALRRRNAELAQELQQIQHPAKALFEPQELYAYSASGRDPYGFHDDDLSTELEGQLFVVQTKTPVEAEYNIREDKEVHEHLLQSIAYYRHLLEIEQPVPQRASDICQLESGALTRVNGVWQVTKMIKIKLV